MSADLLAPTVLRGLKDFQRATVEYVFKRMYLDPDPAHRFLVADEVGLGKTLVARGLIAKVIDHLRDLEVPRIDVIYICSNADIAAQNIRRLKVTGAAAFDLPTRITLLPTRLRQLKSSDVNFISFTPGTSFDLGDRSGRKDERALVYWLLRDAWGGRRLHHAGVFRLLRGGVREDRFEGYVRGYTPRSVGNRADQIDPEISERFAINLTRVAERDILDGRAPIQDRFAEIAERLRRRDRGDVWHDRQEIVGELRNVLAQSCIAALEPDLIILDEFQRFRHLLEEPSENDEVTTLAHQLFDYESTDGHARTLLLSATPYKMYTLSDESADDDHYADFVKITEFLLGSNGSQAFRSELRAYREAILDSGSLGQQTLRNRRRAVEKRLKQVMTRTERLAVTPDRAGMLDARAATGSEVTPDDLRTYLALDGVTRSVGAAGDSLDYWKSSPYPLSFMDAYDVKRRLRAARESDPVTTAAVANCLRDGNGLLDPGLIEAYGRLDPGNARLRSLTEQLLDGDAWRVLWIPPSLPYYGLCGDFKRPGVQKLTKRLIFSSWTVVPQAVASVLSYEAERRMIRTRHRDLGNTIEERRKMRTLLGFRRVGDRAAAMSTFLLMYPSPALAKLTDPLVIGTSANRGGRTQSAEQVVRAAADRIRPALAQVLRQRSADEGPIDEDWYWAAPLLLDRAFASTAQAAFFSRADRDLARAWTGDSSEREPDDVEGLALHIGRARSMVEGTDPLGRPPEDLAEVLALLGVAGPAQCAFRALSRGGSDTEANDVRLLDGAARIAWGFRSLFGLPEVMALIRKRSGTERAYWRRVLEYALDGCLQAVLDEYGHILPEWLGTLDQPVAERASLVAKAMYDALTIRAPLYGYEAISVDGDRVAIEGRRMRARFALRFGVDSTDEEQGVQRSSQVRAAFNSPFWPFVLVTTSVGQEGLDFHLYCHAVVHWNLPANPVDLEQREGRVHRYKGHAVRRNVALAHRRAAYANGGDPWMQMFNAARASRQASRHADLVPYWIFEGPYKIERHVPVLPLSREIERYDRLRKSLAAYRLVFGQPRQEDLVAYLTDRLSPEELARRMSLLRIDLSPPPLAGPKTDE